MQTVKTKNCKMQGVRGVEEEDESMQAGLEELEGVPSNVARSTSER